MNNHMYEHAATQDNLGVLRARGATIVAPETGRLASRGEWGVGRLAEPARILETVEGLLGKAGGPMDGLRVLVTAGGTREPIDSVRYVGNRSSGRMGLALAGEAARRGASVTLVAANVSLPAPAGVRVVEVQTAADLLAAARAEFSEAHVLLMAAAVADFKPGEAVDDKISKSGRDGLSLSLEPTEDVLAALSEARAPGQTLVGFAAEHGAGAVERGRAKLDRKGLDAVVVNDISRSEIGFDAPDNEVTIVTADGERHVPLGSKETVAAGILDVVERLRKTAGEVSTFEGDR
jgi:phosphopantothenoylcysteine decarboxylase/phosphopantothenate--cysteine ligase